MDKPLYHLEKLQSVLTMGEGEITTNICLNPDHLVFRGHFPGFPVLPGVFQINMIRNALETALGQRLWLHSSDQIKFTGIIDPRQHPVLTLDIKLKHIDTKELRVQAVLGTDDLVSLKFKGTFFHG